MKTRSAFVLASALAAVVALAISSGCGSKISKCSSDSDCPLGTCDLTVSRCASVVCDGGAGCPMGTFCDTQVANLCVPIPDGGTNDCAPPCPSHQLCLARQCQNRYSGIAFTQPSDGAFLDGGSPVVAQLIVNTGFPRQDPPTLALMIGLPDGGAASGTLAIQSAGVYQGALLPMGDGRYRLVARYDAANLNSNTINVTILTIPPSFIFAIPDPPSGPDAGYLNSIDPGLGALAWRRDQVMLLGIGSANPNVLPATVSLTVTGVGGPRSTNPSVNATTGCGQPYCANALVDLSQPDMNAFRGTFGLTVMGADRAGNVGRTDADGGVTVTRWKWAFRTLDGLPIRTSPAIGSSGTVYVGTSNGTDAGTLYAINPDGTIKWSTDAGWITASVAVGDLDGGIETVYAAVNDPIQATLRAINGTNGSDLVAPCSSPGAAIRASLAVTRVNGAEACLAAINSPDGGVMLAMQPFPLPRTCIDGGSVNPGGPLLEPAAVAVDNNNNVFFALSSLRIHSLAFNGGWQVRNPPNWPVDAGANSVGLAIAGNPSSVVGSATTMDGGRGGVFAIAAFDGGQTWIFTDAGDPRTAWNPSITSGATVFFGDEGSKLTSVAIGNSTPNAQATNAGISRGAPILGNDGTVYVADWSTNAISARRSTSLNPIWSVNNFGPNPFEASLALDCSRDGGVSAQLRPGVLYAPDNLRNLFCFITDSRGIDAFSAWPKYQHDPRNTGNQQTSLFQLACP